MLQFLWFSLQSTFAVQTLCYDVPLQPGKSDRSFTEKQIIAVFTYYEFRVDWSLSPSCVPSFNGRLGSNVCGILVTAWLTSDIMLKQVIIILYLVNRLFFSFLSLLMSFGLFFCLYSVGYRGKFSRVIKGINDFISFNSNLNFMLHLLHWKFSFLVLPLLNMLYISAMDKDGSWILVNLCQIFIHSLDSLKRW